MLLSSVAELGHYPTITYISSVLYSSLLSSKIITPIAAPIAQQPIQVYYSFVVSLLVP